MSSDATERIISLTHKASEHPVRNAIIFMTGWIILIALGLIMLVVLVWPRTQGYVTMVYPGAEASGEFSTGDLLYFEKVRQESAQNLNLGDTVAVQPTEEVEYQVAKITELLGAGDSTQFTVDFISPEQSPNQRVTLDMMRGKLVYKIPFFGIPYGIFNDDIRSFMLVFIAELLLIYAGWQIGTSMINARDPQRQARAARLRTAALAGNLETTRQRLRSQGLR